MRSASGQRFRHDDITSPGDGQYHPPVLMAYPEGPSTYWVLGPFGTVLSRT